MKVKKLKPYLLAFIWGLGILYLSTSPGIQLPSIGISADKIGHVGAYGLLSFLIFQGQIKTGSFNKSNTIWTVVGVSFYGILLEFVQWAFFPHRFFEVWDMIANITGACLSYLLIRLFTYKT